MRAPVFVGLVAVALSTTACSSSSASDPIPSFAANGMIAEIASPEAPFEAAWTSTVGDDGAAVVFFMRTPGLLDLELPTAGIAVVYRDGTFDVVVDPGDARFENEWPMRSAISDTTVAWASVENNCDPKRDDCASLMHFWDRGSNEISDGPTTVTEGEAIGMPLRPGSLDLALVGDVLYWPQWNPDSTEPRELMVVATSDGRAWLPIGGNRSWFRLGKDECASTPGHVVLWAEEQIFGDDSTSFLFWSIDATDPRHPVVLEDSAWTTDRSSDTIPYTFGVRCGGEVLAVTKADAVGTERSEYPLVIVDDRDPAGITTLENGTGGPPMGASFTPEWISLPASILHIEGRSLIHRPSGVSVQLPTDGFCTSIEIHGGFVAWQVPTRGPVPSSGPLAARCDTLVGRLVEP